MKENNKKKESEIAYDMRKLAGTTVLATMKDGRRVLVDITSKQNAPYFQTFLDGGWQLVNKKNFVIDWNTNPLIRASK